MSGSNCRDLIQDGIDFLESAGVPDARMSVEMLLSAVAAKPRHFLYLDETQKLASSKLGTYRALLRALAARQPLQYLVRTVGFRDIVLEIGPGCFIPRPETEILVEVVLKRLRDASIPLTSLRANGYGSPLLQVLDVGTGSGNIAISLAKEFSQSFVTALDISPAALRYARRNAERNGACHQIQLIQTDLCRGIANARFDGVVSNPPYLSEVEMSSLQAEVSQEPPLALDGGPDGLAFFRRIALEARRILKRGGFAAFEIGMGQSEAVGSILKENGFGSIEVTQDYSGIDRVISARMVGRGSPTT